MAIATLEGGWGDGLIRHWTDVNFATLVTTDAAARGLLSDMESVAGKGKTEYRAVCNSNMVLINAAYTTSYTPIYEGESWSAMKDKMNTNFAAFAAAMALASPSSSPSGTPSSSPSATPSTSPSASPSEGTPSLGTGSASGSPSEGTPSTSPSDGSPSDSPSGSPSEGTPSSSPSA